MLVVWLEIAISKFLNCEYINLLIKPAIVIISMSVIYDMNSNDEDNDSNSSSDNFSKKNIHRRLQKVRSGLPPN